MPGTILLLLAFGLPALGALAAQGPAAGHWLVRPLRLAALAGQAGSLLALAVLLAAGDGSCAYAAAQGLPAGAALPARLAAVWAGQEGSLLLWALELGLASLVLPAAANRPALSHLLTLQAALAGAALLGAPFLPPAPGAAPGALNPALISGFMLIHPPLLFAGYAVLAVIFCLTLQERAQSTPAAWAARIRPWVLAGLVLLGAGMGFGSLWAYRSFGWGGFWAWDPVENLALVPWLCCLAGLHGLRRAPDSAPARTLAVGSLLAAFLCILLGAWLVRGGHLADASVHAYLPGRGLMAGALLALLAWGAAQAVITRRARAEAWHHAAAAGTDPSWKPALWLVPLCILPAWVLAGIGLDAAGLGPTSWFYVAGCAPLIIAAAALRAWSRPMASAAGTLPAQLGHNGLKLLAAGALIAALATFQGVRWFSVGESAPAGRTTVGLLGLEETAPGGVRAQVVLDGVRGQARTRTSPLFRQPLREPFILRRWWGDWHVALLEAVTPAMAAAGHPGPAGARLQVTRKPGMPLVWMGMLFAEIGLALALLPGRRGRRGQR